MSGADVVFEEGSARSLGDAVERLGGADDVDVLAETYVALRGGAVDDDTLWAVATARLDQLDAVERAAR